MPLPDLVRADGAGTVIMQGSPMAADDTAHRNTGLGVLATEKSKVTDEERMMPQVSKYVGRNSTVTDPVAWQRHMSARLNSRAHTARLMDVHGPPEH